jgi:hypothetical protein
MGPKEREIKRRLRVLEHDFPQRIEYRRDGDKLYAEVAGPGNNGVEAEIRLDFGTCENSL